MNMRRNIRPLQALLGLCVLCLVCSGTLRAQRSTVSQDYTLSDGICVALAGRLRGPLLLTGAVGGSGSPVGTANSDSYILTSGVAIPDVMVEWLSYTLEMGWNLCGAPGASSKVIGEIFRGARGLPIKLGNAQYFDGASETYVEVGDDERLRAEKGFFVYSYWGGGSREFACEGAVASNWKDGLSPGWNLYSPPYAIVLDEEDGPLTIFRLNAGGVYEQMGITDILTVGRGYWVYRSDRREAAEE